MKYRLKKDLPFANAGDLVQYVNGHICTGTHSCTVPFGLINKWVEVVRLEPREWEVQLVNGNISSGTVSYSIGDYPTTEFIKVREVIK